MPEIAEFFTHHATNPIWVLLSLFVMTFILEDVAVASGAYVVSENIAAPLMVIVTLFLGILLGDILLYCIGRAAHHNRWAARFTQKKSVTTIKQHFRRHVFFSVLTSRFIPGLRLPVYVAAGFFHTSLAQFFISALVAVMLWGAMATTLFYYTDASQLPLVIIGFLFLPILIKSWRRWKSSRLS